MGVGRSEGESGPQRGREWAGRPELAASWAEGLAEGLAADRAPLKCTAPE